MVHQKKILLILFIIILSATFLRFWSLVQYPPSLNWDEVSHAYNAYSLLKTGRDQWGIAFPFPNFRAFGDYPTVLNIYLTVPAIAIFGANDFAVRFPHALIGSLTCLMLFIAAYSWSKNKYIGLTAAFLCAFSPWTFFPSRAIFQSNWAVFLLSLSMALYFTKKYYLTFLILTLSLFAYHNTRIFSPLIITGIIFIIRKQKKLVFTGVISLIVALLLLLNPQSSARSPWVSIIDQGAVAFLEQARNTTKLPVLAARLLYNRPLYFGVSLVSHYFDYFSPRFLFLSGGTQYQFSVPKFGLINPVFLPFFYLGLFYLLRRKQYFLILWMAFSPLPAALTRDMDAVIRATTMIPAVYLTTAAGFIYFFRLINYRFIIPLFSLILISFSTIQYQYLHSYFTDYTQNYASSWQYGYSQLTAYLEAKYPKYDQILITKRYGEPHEFLLWYWPWNPTSYLSDPNLSWNYHDYWYWVDSFSKFRFINDWEMSAKVNNLPPDEKYLIISSAPIPATRLTEIKYLDGQTAFYIYEK